ncbi:amidohydrolase [Affinibrenneria salicis]|uniref:Amidohydrolase n=1 Tax=Affinibrenneria salicis TaxID=2590031 RepID=A0A5J5G150_9GAMM|nr:M20 aminoacylase family protein [Affinibrenneria salicis]KAA9000444.1 amidohydrolase [Affinibrenneria salicis]
MPISQNLIAEATAWRHEFHANPELGYEEHATSKRVAELLTSFGLQVHTGLGGTGIVGTLENGQGPTIGLRADMDALPITELGDVSYKSKNQGVMHACGHDGHTAILLAAARHLSETRNFSGTVHFVFQPAEENLGGAYKMVADGLFERFPMDAIYALHNWPGLPVGHVGLNSGVMMASLDSFEIVLTGKSCHAAMPENGADPIVAASQLVLSLQTIPARRLSPQSSAVVSITQISGGEAINVIPEKVTLRGTMRCLQTDVRIKVKELINEFVSELPRVFGVSGEISYYPGYPVTLNHEQEALNVREAVSSVLGESKVHWQLNPSMASEDFACMLEACPGAYFWIGSDGAVPSKPLHNAYYDFNDELIEPGVASWTSLVEKLLLKS